APHERRTGLVFQSYALFPHLSARENVEIALSHVLRRDRQAAADAILARVGLAGTGARRPASLSGGEQHRVALARALAREPDILLLDEPFSAIDRRTRRRLQADLAALRGQLQAPIILVTHDLDEAIALADDVVVIDHGVMLQAGPVQEVLAAPNSDVVRAILDLAESS
ncbi:MAG: ATP-binding cassette domain-containing protein, partial [Gemmatimonas sp.]